MRRCLEPNILSPRHETPYIYNTRVQHAFDDVAGNGRRNQLSPAAAAFLVAAASASFS